MFLWKLIQNTKRNFKFILIPLNSRSCSVCFIFPDKWFCILTMSGHSSYRNQKKILCKYMREKDIWSHNYYRHFYLIINNLLCFLTFVSYTFKDITAFDFGKIVPKLRTIINLETIRYYHIDLFIMHVFPFDILLWRNNSHGQVRWLSRYRHLLPNLITWIQILDPTY